MKTLFATLMLLIVNISNAAPFQPQPLQFDSLGDVDVAVLCALSGANCDLGTPMLALMATDGTPQSQAQIDAATVIPFNFDAITGDIRASEMTVATTLFGTVYENSTGGQIVAPDTAEWFEILKLDESTSQWIATATAEFVGGNAHVLGWPDGTTALLNDAIAADDVVVAPIPAAIWLFGAGLVGMVSVARPKRSN